MLRRVGLSHSFRQWLSRLGTNGHLHDVYGSAGDLAQCGPVAVRQRRWIGQLLQRIGRSDLGVCRFVHLDPRQAHPWVWRRLSPLASDPQPGRRLLWRLELQFGLVQTNSPTVPTHQCRSTSKPQWPVRNRQRRRRHASRLLQRRGWIRPRSAEPDQYGRQPAGPRLQLLRTVLCRTTGRSPRS